VKYRHAERVSTKFWRSFNLPETIKQDNIEANYKDGVLEVKIPKAEEAKPRQIEISVH
jgi:HSP20 family protein